MQLIQILLPLTDNTGKSLSRKYFTRIKKELTRRFKGLTAYTRSPAEGIWKPRGGIERDEIVVYEVMASNLEERWWKRYRRRLEKRLRQESIVIRAQGIKVI